MSYKEKENNFFDVIIIGGGFCGLTMACCLADSDLKIAIINDKDVNKIDSSTNDGRAFALAYGSWEILKKIDIYNEIKNYSSPINDIRVSDNNYSSFLHYNHRLMGRKPMGYMIETHYLLNALQDKIQRHKNIKLFAPIQYKEIIYKENSASVELDDSTLLNTSLIIASDGKMSKIRKKSKIDTAIYDYKQTGIVCTIEHEKNHNNLAQEKFLTTGPFAILPLKGGHKSSLVWTEKPNLARIYTNMAKNEFEEHLANKFGKYLGNIKLISNIYSYPLILAHAKKYYSTRLALVGDAAHGIHPLAGQGFNLGVRSIEKLSNLILENKNLGLDIGSQNLLKEYDKLRKFDAHSLIFITSFLNQLFLNKNIFIKTMRHIGLNIVNNNNSLKKQFMKHAMGI